MGILSLAIVLAFVSTGVQSCSQFEVEQCMQPITDLRARLGISAKLAYFPVYSLNANQLEDYCSAGSLMASCLKGLYDCDDGVRRTFEGVQNAITFLCIDTLQEYKTHQKCYAEKSVIGGLETCNAQAKESFSSLDINAYGGKDAFCGYVKDDYSCIRNTVEPECGKEAADWEVNYAKKVIQPLVDLVKCNVNTEDRAIATTHKFGVFPKWTIIGAVIGVGSTLLVFGAGGIYVMFRKKKGNVASNQFNNVLANQKI